MVKKKRKSGESYTYLCKIACFFRNRRRRVNHTYVLQGDPNEIPKDKFHKLPDNYDKAQESYDEKNPSEMLKVDLLKYAKEDLGLKVDKKMTRKKILEKVVEEEEKLK